MCAGNSFFTCALHHGLSSGLPRHSLALSNDLGAKFSCFVPCGTRSQRAASYFHKPSMCNLPIFPVIPIQHFIPCHDVIGDCASLVNINTFWTLNRLSMFEQRRSRTCVGEGQSNAHCNIALNKPRLRSEYAAGHQRPCVHYKPVPRSKRHARPKPFAVRGNNRVTSL